MGHGFHGELLNNQRVSILTIDSMDIHHTTYQYLWYPMFDGQNSPESTEYLDISLLGGWRGFDPKKAEFYRRPSQRYPQQ